MDNEEITVIQVRNNPDLKLDQEVLNCPFNIDDIGKFLPHVTLDGITSVSWMKKYNKEKSLDEVISISINFTNTYTRHNEEE